MAKRNAFQEAQAMFQRLSQGAGNVVGNAVQSFQQPRMSQIPQRAPLIQTPLANARPINFAPIVNTIRPIVGQVFNNPLTTNQRNYNLIKPVLQFATGSPNLNQTPVGQFLRGNYQQAVNSVVPTLQRANQQVKTAFKVNPQTKRLVDPKLAASYSTQGVLGGLGPTGGSIGKVKVLRKELEPTVKLLRNRLNSEDIRLLGKFGALVEKAKGQANRKALGELGPQIQTFLEAAFGKKAATWTNQQANENINYVLRRIAEKSNSAGIGLSIADVSGAFGKQNKSILKGQKLAGEILDPRLKVGKTRQSLEELGVASLDNPITPQSKLKQLSVNPEVGISSSKNSIAQGVKPSVVKERITDIKKTKSLYHETSPQNAQGLLDSIVNPNVQTRPKIFTSNNSAMAKGQGGKGIVFEFDEAIKSTENLNKPALGFTSKQGSKEFVSQPDSIKAIIVDEKTLKELQLARRNHQVLDFANTQSIGNGKYRISSLPQQTGGVRSIGVRPPNTVLNPKTGQPFSNSSQKVVEQRPQTGQIQGSGQSSIPPESKVPQGEAYNPDSIIQKVKDKVNNFYTASLDRFHPISQLGKKAGEDQAMRNALTGYYGAGSIGKYHADFELSPILKSVDSNDLRDFTIAQRDLELAGRDIQGSNLGDANKVIENLRQKYGNTSQLEEAATKLYKYQRDLIQEYLVNTGIISKENFAAMTSKNQKYVPFKRVMNQVDEFLGVPQTKGAGSVGSQSIIKGIKGSKRDIVDPLQSIIENTYKVVGLGQRQKVAQTIVSLKDSLPTGMVQKFNGEVGTKPVISVFENGKAQKYLVPREVADAAKGLSEEGMNTIVKILAAPTRVFRATATGANPEFAIPNVARDLQSTFINNGLNPLKFVSGLAHYMKKDQVYQDFLKAGGQTSRISLDQPFLKQSVKDLTGQKRGLRLVDPRRIYSILQAVGQASEQPTRIASFEAARNAALKKGLPDAAARGAYAAQEGSVNFARRGSQTQGFNAIYAFLNARAQGVDRLIRSAKNDPVGVGFRLGLVTIAPSIGLYAHNRNFKAYNDPRIVPDYEKENNFIIMLSDEPVSALGGAQYLKIPKGDVGKLANPLEAFMSYADGKDGDVKNALLSVLKGFSPISNAGDIIPTALRPTVENATNFNFFTNRQIVPDSKENYPKEFQFNKNTSPIYKQIGSLTGQSPLKIENLTRGYLTGFARIGEMAAKPFAKEDKYTGENVNQTPVLRRFMGGAVRSEEEQELNNTYELKDFQKQIQDIRTGIKYGNIPEADGINAIQKLQQQVETEEKKQQSYFGPQSASATESTTSIADQIRIDNLKSQVKSTGKPQEYGGKIYHQKGDKVYSIDLRSKFDEPKFIGQTELDKAELSAYSGKVTSKINEIRTLTQLENPSTKQPYLSGEQAELLVVGLKQKLANIKASQQPSLKLTGDPVIDKKIISQQKSQITSQINDIVKYVQDGRLTVEQGRSLIDRLNAKSKRVGTGGVKKVKIPKLKAIKPLKFKSSKVKSIKIPRVKLPKYKKVRVRQ